MIAITQVTAPEYEPVELTEAKLHLKVDDDADDDLILSIISAARQSVENYTWMKLYTGTYELTLDGFDSIIEIPTRPVQSITSIKYYNTSNVLTTLASTSYLSELNGCPARVFPVETWPSTYNRPGSVVIRFVAGSTNTADVPASIKSAMKLMITHLYENRGDNGNRVDSQMPQTVQWLLDPYRCYAY